MEKWKLSAYLSDRLAKSYTLLSSAFSAARGMTIERFFILQKVERAKELLIYDELTMSEIRFSPQLFESGSSERTIQTNHRHVRLRTSNVSAVNDTRSTGSEPKRRGASSILLLQ